MKKIVCIDVETTGLNPKTNQIIQLSSIKFDPSTWEVEGEFNEYINPTPGTKPAIEMAAQSITNITPEFLLEHGKTQKEVFSKFLEFIGDCDYLTYNGNTFDFRFLVEDFKSIGLTFPLDDRRFYDAYAMECKFFPRNLSSVYKKYTNKDLEGAHNSLVDVQATIEVFRKQLEINELTFDEIDNWSENNLFDIDGMVRESYQEGPQRILFNQGKYKNRDLWDILQIDPQYIRWWASVANPSTISKVRKYLIDLKNQN